MVKLATFGLLCVAAFVVAAHSHEERKFCVFASKVVGINWLLFSMPWIYNPLSPAHIAVTWGVPAHHIDMWAICDMTAMILLATAGRNVWWSPVLWCINMSMLATYAVAWSSGMEYVEYETILDAGLVIQLATIIAVGGEGCADRLSDCWRSIRGMGRAAGASIETFSADEAAQ